MRKHEAEAAKPRNRVIAMLKVARAMGGHLRWCFAFLRACWMVFEGGLGVSVGASGSFGRCGWSLKVCLSLGRCLACFSQQVRALASILEISG